jgi:hypothetical protein
MAGQTGKVRRRMTDQEREQIEKQGLSEAAAGRALREPDGVLDLGPDTPIFRTGVTGRELAPAGKVTESEPVDAEIRKYLARRFGSPSSMLGPARSDMDFTTLQPTVTGRPPTLPSRPNPRVSLRRKRKPLPRSDSRYRKH